ncbi:uncharacterized protein K444DRAFT_608450 [Hyaloscypha bicolor E]|uniref:DUF7730 domain-containing protein n=1 Tax=Hyaloscypha bicolor E TaxID=1095630 RepID=A0A2J6TP35_9HELO|nr:uncharacterized protein K444DRAFT_608450 [Hyaloscypha bicolor E]PMD64774.1 hypothetical protein K444DRAFT_608450 [Hyaloscypha bicolor E]
MSLSQPQISGPSTSRATTDSQAPNPQLASSFLTLLPFEIRQHIYKEVIASFSWGNKLHIFSRNQQPIERYGKQKEVTSQLTYIPCTLPPRDQLPLSQNTYGYSPSWPTQHEWCQGWKATGQAPPPLQGTYLNFFLSCRRIYEEAIGLLYSEHSFAITSLGTMHRFLTTVSPQHLNLIQSLHVTTIIPDIHLFGSVHPSEMPIAVQIKRQETEIYWLTCCMALSRMAGLRNLEIEFWNETHQLIWGENILKGLSSVKVLEGGNFVVRLPWQDEAHVAIESKVVGEFKVEWRAFGAEPVNDRATAREYHDPPLRCCEVAFFVLCSPCILLFGAGLGVRTLVKRTMRRRS